MPMAIPKRRKNFNAHPTRTARSLSFRWPSTNAFDELWRHAFRIQQHGLPPRSAQCSRGGHCVDAMHVDTASDIDDDDSAATATTQLSTGRRSLPC
eukprot:6181982-Pleurochrysis_carterae.AAC.2